MTANRVDIAVVEAYNNHINNVFAVIEAHI